MPQNGLMSIEEKNLLSYLMVVIRPTLNNLVIIFILFVYFSYLFIFKLQTREPPGEVLFSRVHSLHSTYQVPSAYLFDSHRITEILLNIFIFFIWSF